MIPELLSQATSTEPLTGRSPAGASPSTPIGATPGRVDHLIPDGLRTAVTVGAIEPDVPPQGFAELRDFLLHGTVDLDRTQVSEWLATQERAQRRADELLDLLPFTAGELPEYHLEWWYQTLMYPWAESLSVAVTFGFLYLHA